MISDNVSPEQEMIDFEEGELKVSAYAIKSRNSMEKNRKSSHNKNYKDFLKGLNDSAVNPNEDLISP